MNALRSRPVRRAAVVGGLVLSLLGAAGVLGRASQSPGPSETAARRTDAADPADPIGVLTARLRRVPGDWPGWAALASAYVEQARVSADPGYYAKALAAVDRSLRLRPDGNAAALTARAATKAALHDFPGAHADASSARRINPYHAETLGVLGDALIELGRYDEAYAVIQQMVDLKPGVASYSRVAYARELQGDVAGATRALEAAGAAAFTRADRGFADVQLAELAWNSGDLRLAAERYAAGLRRDPDSLPLLAGRARTAAAAGDTAAALRDYATVVERLPSPEYLLDYAELLTSLGRTAEAAAQHELLRAQQRLQAASGQNIDLELALFDADHGRPLQALAAAGREIARRRSVHVEDAYAWALHVNGRDREALVHAERALRLGTRDATFHFHKGVIEAELGLHAAARRDLSRALEINPNFSPRYAPEATRLLAGLP